MAKGVAAIHLKRVRGKLTVFTQGQTARGQKYLKDQEALKAEHTTSKGFKAELTAAAEKLLA